MSDADLRARDLSTTQAHRAAKVCLEFHVIASEAKQSILSLRGTMDCFASLAMTVSKLLAIEQLVGRISDSVIRHYPGAMADYAFGSIRPTG